MFVLSALNLFAQQTKSGSIVRRDTINIRGYIYDETGRPVKDIRLYSSQKYIDFEGTNIVAQTDTSGHFILEGVKFNDTLTVEENILYAPRLVYNKGSRFLIIYLPFAAPKDINQKGQITISAKRARSKIVPSFTRKISNDAYDPFIGMHLVAYYKGGNERFIKLVNQQVHYPAKAVENNIEGIVQIAFKVEKDGRPAGFKVLKGIGYGCEEEVINTIKNLRGWVPGIENGRPVVTSQTVSVEYKLTDK
jgi:TonB family protein